MLQRSCLCRVRDYPAPPQAVMYYTLQEGVLLYYIWNTLHKFPANITVTIIEAKIANSLITNQAMFGNGDGYVWNIRFSDLSLHHIFLLWHSHTDPSTSYDIMLHHSSHMTFTYYDINLLSTYNYKVEMRPGIEMGGVTYRRFASLYCNVFYCILTNFKMYNLLLYNTGLPASLK